MTPAQRFRSAFPMLGRTAHLSSCSLGARSTALDEAMDRMLSAMTAGGGAWAAFEAQVTEARERFAALIGAAPAQVAVLPNASVGAYQVASTLDLDRRDGIVTCADEFPSVAHVWLGQQARGAKVTFAESYPEAIGAGTALVSVPLVTYADGVVQPVAEVAGHAHDHGARVFVDAYQAAGVVPIDVTALDCDYLVAGTQKYLCGLPGIAFLYARAGLAETREPTLTGWFGRRDPFAFDPRQLDFADGARRYETGTPAVPAAYAANAGLGLVGDLDLAAVRRHVTGLLTVVADRLAADGERLHINPAGVAAHGAHLGLLDDDPAGLTAWLAQHGVAVSPRGPLVRISVHYYSDEGDVDRLCAAVRAFRHATTMRGARHADG